MARPTPDPVAGHLHIRECLIAATGGMPTHGKGRAQDNRIRMALAEALCIVGGPAQADAQYRAVLGSAPRHRGALLGRVICALQQHKPEDVVRRTEEALVHFPGNAEPILHKVSALRHIGQTAEAAELLKSLRDRMPKPVTRRLELVRKLQVSGDPAAGHPHIRECLIAAIGGMPTRGKGRAQDNRIRLALAETLCIIGESAQADAQYRAVLGSVPRHRDALPGRVICALQQHKPEDTVRRAEEALIHFPGDAELILHKAAALRHIGQTAEAAELLKSLRDRVPGPVTLQLELARLLQISGDRAGADAIYAGVLKTRPKDRAARLGRVICTLQQRKFEDAVRRAEEALIHFPGDAELILHKAAALRHIGQTAESAELLKSLRNRVPGPVTLQLKLARLLQISGDRAGADAIYAGVLKTRPKDRVARLGRINTALADADVDRALTYCDRALNVLPEDPGILERRAVVLLQAGRALEAAEQLQAVMGRTSDKVATRTLLARAYWNSGNSVAADKMYTALLRVVPDHYRALIGRIDVALAEGKHSLALRRCKAALVHLPDDRRILQRHLRVLQKENRFEDTIDLLKHEVSAAPGDTALRLDLARAYLAAGAYDDADAICRDILKSAPDHGDTVLVQIDIAETRGKPDLAKSLLEHRLTGQSAGPVRPDPPEPADDRAKFLLRYLELCLTSRDAGRIAKTFQDLAGEIAVLDEPALVRLLRLGKDHKQFDLAVLAVRALLDLPALQPGTALRLLRLACMQEGSETPGPLTDYQEQKLRTSHRRKFRVDAAMLRFGPEQALAEARAHADPRSADEAAQLGQILRAAGETRLACRYLRRCYRRWPDAPIFRDALFQTYLRGGQPHQAKVFLDRIGTGIPASAHTDLQIRLAVEAGSFHEAYDLIRHQRGSAPAMRDLKRRMDVCLVLGYLKEAEALVPEISALSAGTSDARFRLTRGGKLLGRQGALLVELQLCHRLSTPELPAGSHNGFAPAPEYPFFFPAKQAVDAWIAQSPNLWLCGAAPGIPRRIFQYWDTPDCPPEIARVMESWQNRSGYDYAKLDRRDAIAFLEKRFGPIYSRAFTLANHVAEECDFLRLCLLYADGGIYADADDKLIGDPDTLLARGGTVILFHEPREISNNIMIAGPGHPLIGLAMDMACQSLLARETDCTWAKTGPGLITRAVATYIGQSGRQNRKNGLHLLPKYEMHRYVHPHMQMPYKSTSKYWDILQDTMPRAVFETLAAAVGGDRQNDVA